MDYKGALEYTIIYFLTYVRNINDSKRSSLVQKRLFEEEIIQYIKYIKDINHNDILVNSNETEKFLIYNWLTVYSITPYYQLLKDMMHKVSYYLFNESLKKLNLNI